MKKLIVSSMLVALLGVFALPGFAVDTTTVTNRGVVITTKVLDDVAADVAQKGEYQDYSVYPGKVGQVGKIVRFYDFDKQGGGEATTFKLLPAIPLKDNTLIRNGYVKVMEAVIPQAGGTNALEIGSLVLKTAATNTLIAADLLVAVIPVGTVATALQTTDATSYVELVNTGAAITNGKFMVVLDVELAP